MPMLMDDNPYFNVEVPDPKDVDFRVYHSRIRLMDDGCQGMSAYKGVTRIGQDQDGNDIPLPSMMEFALEVEGVVWVAISAYSLSIRKATVYKWDDIDKKVIALFIGIKALIDADLTPPV